MRVQDCPFCDYAGPNSVLWSDRMVYAIEPLAPVVRGHLLFIPFAHVESALASPAMAGIVMERAARWGADHMPWGSVNLIASCGRAATQTVPHLHVHLVPRAEHDGLALPWTGLLDGGQVRL